MEIDLLFDSIGQKFEDFRLDLFEESKFSFVMVKHYYWRLFVKAVQWSRLLKKDLCCLFVAEEEFLNDALPMIHFAYFVSPFQTKLFYSNLLQNGKDFGRMSPNHRTTKLATISQAFMDKVSMNKTSVICATHLSFTAKNGLNFRQFHRNCLFLEYS